MKYSNPKIRNLPESGIDYMSNLAATIPNAISLGQGVPSVQTPRYIREGIIDLLQSNPAIGKYSLQSGLPELKKVIAQRLSTTANITLDAETEIVITTGAIEGLMSAMITILEQNDEVVLFDPGYAYHSMQVQIAGGKPIFVALDENNGWRLDANALAKAITTKTKAIVLCNPSNPTGRVFTRLELDMVVACALENDLVVIADETYEFFVYEPNQFISLLAYPRLSEQLIVCRSFSKEFAMTGWRVGYLYAPRLIMRELLKVHYATIICAPTISQYAAYIALTEKPFPGDPDIKALLAKRKDILCRRLDELSSLFTYCKPQGAYYVLARYDSQLNSKDFADKLLKEANVVTIPGSAFGPQGEYHIRMSFGGTPEEINEAFDRITAWNKTLTDLIN